MHLEIFTCKTYLPSLHNEYPASLHEFPLSQVHYNHEAQAEVLCTLDPACQRLLILQQREGERSVHTLLAGFCW
jgi:hypothetical protein